KASRIYCAADVVQHGAAVRHRQLRRRHPRALEQPVVAELRQRPQMEDVVEVVLDEPPQRGWVALELRAPESNRVRARKRCKVRWPEESGARLERFQAALLA